MEVDGSDDFPFQLGDFLGFMPNLELHRCLGEPASKLWGCIDNEQSIHNVLVSPLSANPSTPRHV